MPQQQAQKLPLSTTTKTRYLLPFFFPSGGSLRCPQPIKGWALPCPFLSLSCSLGTLNTTPWWGAAMSFGYPRFLWCTCVPPGTSIHHKCTYIYPRGTFLYKFIQILPLGTRLQFVKRVYRTVLWSGAAKPDYGGMSCLNQKLGTAFKTAGFSHLAHFLYQNNAFLRCPQN